LVRGRLFTSRQLRRGLVGSVILVVPLVALAVVAATRGSASLQRTLISFFITAMMVLAVQVFVGNSGILSFGHVAFAGIGAYAAALVTIPPTLRLTVLPELPSILHNVELGLVGSVVLAAALAAGTAIILGGALTRMSELAMAVATLALLVVMHSVFVNWSSVTRGTTGIFGIPANATLFVSLCGLVLLILVARLYRESRPGLRLQSTREDPRSAKAVGVHVPGTRLGAWVLSAAAMGAAGALFAQSIIAFDPDQFYFGLTFTILSMLVLGGRSSVSGRTPHWQPWSLVRPLVGRSM